MEATDYLQTMHRYWRVILVTTLIGGIAAALLGLATRQQVVAQYSATASAVLLTPAATAKVQEQVRQSEQYVATTSLLVPVDAKGASRVPTLSQVLVSDLVLAPAAKALGTTVEDVQARLSVRVPPGTEIMEISTSGPDEDAARKLGSTVVRELTSQLAVLDAQAAAPLTLGATMAKPRLAADASAAQVQAEEARLARALITADPSAAQTIVTPVLALFDESLVAELATNLKISGNPTDLFTAFVITAGVGAADPATGLIPNTGEIAISVTANGADNATALARGAATILQERAAKAAGRDSTTPSPLVITVVSDSAVVAATGNGNRTLTNLILGLLIGFAGGVGYAFFRGSRDTAIRTPHQLLALTDTPPIGVVTARQVDAATPWAALDMADPATDGYRSLRSNLLFGAPDLRVLAVTSPEAGDGKLTIAVNLAIALAQSGRSVALVETDLRHPRLAKALDLAPDLGLADVLSGGEPGTSIQAAHQPWLPGSLSVICAGSPVPNPSELLSSDRYAAALADLRTNYDYVICLTGPILAATDAVIVARLSDGALLVLRHAQTTTTQVAAAATALIQVNAPVAGTVITGVPANEVLNWRIVTGSAPVEA